MRKTINKTSFKTALAELGWTQGQLATEVGTSSQAVTNWLKGKDFPRPPTLLKLATTLKLTFEQLVEQDNKSRPIVAFRKKGSAKTTSEHITKATEMGMLLKPLVPYLPEMQVLRTLITSPSIDYNKLQMAASQTRDRLGLGSMTALEYDHLIKEFKNCGAVLTPVLWGEQKQHKNALHIRLPIEDVTFIWVNLDTRLEDFKFWMTHELAHVYTPDLAGTDEGEDYADAFAGALLFPQACAKKAYDEAIKQTTEKEKIKILDKYSEEHSISLNTVFQQIKEYVNAMKLTSLNISEKVIHITRNSNHSRLVSETLFDPMPPNAKHYIAACENVFQSGFFTALKRIIHEKEIGDSYIQQALDTSFMDAKAIYEEIRH